MSTETPRPEAGAESVRKQSTAVATRVGDGGGTLPATQVAAPAPAPARHSDSLKFDAVVRQASALAKSTVIPTDYQGSPANCLVALEMAQRVGMPALTVMQNLHIIKGRPTWSATFLVAAVNACGRFSPLRYRFSGTEDKDDWGCRAVATDLESGEELAGTLITIQMAKADGWYGRKDSKWPRFPEQMLRYRAAAFWARVYAPEIAAGLHTVDEMRDMADPAQERAALAASALDGPEPEEVDDA